MTDVWTPGPPDVRGRASLPGAGAVALPPEFSRVAQAAYVLAQAQAAAAEGVKVEAPRPHHASRDTRRRRATVRAARRANRGQRPTGGKR